MTEAQHKKEDRNMAVVSSKKKDELTGNSGSMSVSGGTGSAQAISGVKLGSGNTATNGGGMSGILQSVANTVKNAQKASAARWLATFPDFAPPMPSHMIASRHSGPNCIRL